MPVSAMNSQNQGLAPQEYAEQAFKDHFSKTAYNVLFSRFAELAPEVVTFKILSVDAEKGNSVGAFILLHYNKPLYIPVCMVDSRLKPLDIFYSKDLNMFLPLDKKWLDEVARTSLSELGESQAIPENVPRDVNIRSLVLPPLAAGRYGYASDLDHGIKKMLVAAKEIAFNKTATCFLSILPKLPTNALEGLKLAFEKHPKTLQKLASYYGITELAQMYQTGIEAHVKTASVIVDHGVYILDNTASSDQIKYVFQEKAAAAYATILKQGYDVKDNRDGVGNVVAPVETQAKLETAVPEGGWYRLHFLEKDPEVCYLAPIKQTFHNGHDAPWGNEPDHITTHFMVIPSNMKNAFEACSPILGEPLTDSKDYENTPLCKFFLAEGEGDKPAIGDYGFFITADKTHTTTPLDVVTEVTSEGDCLKVRPSTRYSVIIKDPSNANKNIVNVTTPGHTSSHEALVFVPNSAKWLKVEKLTPDKDGYYNTYDVRKNAKAFSIINSPRLLNKWLDHGLRKHGAFEPDVVYDGASSWFVNHTGDALPKLVALKKVAEAYDVTVKDADTLLAASRQSKLASYRVIPKLALLKMAQGGMPQQQLPPMPPQQQTPPPQGQGQPQMMPSQPAMSPLSPTDLAIQEMVQQLQQQNELQQQQLQSQQQQTQQMMGVLQGLQQRSQEIAQATGGGIPAGAEGSPAAAAQLLAPPPEEEPPMPVMPEEPESAEQISQQINPQMVDSAEELQNSEVFDTAAVGMLASVPSLQQIVSTYIPNMEHCLDNLGRVLLSMWLTETETRDSLGDQTFIDLENRIRTVFRELGTVILDVSHNSLGTTEGDAAQQQTASS